MNRGRVFSGDLAEVSEWLRLHAVCRDVIVQISMLGRWPCSCEPGQVVGLFAAGLPVHLGGSGFQQQQSWHKGAQVLFVPALTFLPGTQPYVPERSAGHFISWLFTAAPCSGRGILMPSFCQVERWYDLLEAVEATLYPLTSFCQRLPGVA